MGIKQWGAAVVAGVLALAAAGVAVAERDSARVYVFGNSLVHHLDETAPNANVPHWLNEMARAGGRNLQLDGRWGFMRNFAEDLPPFNNWSFPGVARLNGQTPDAYVVTPANFIQNNLPNVPYGGENPTGETPFGAALTVFDWAAQAAPDARLFVYEGWALMRVITGEFPPDAEGLTRYHAANGGDYHLWFEDLIGMLENARPGRDIGLIPVARVFSQLFGPGGVLQDMPVEALYTDGAPHGTETLYFLAAMVTYSALYEAPPPADYRPPSSLDPRVGARYAQIAEAVWDNRAEPPLPVQARAETDDLETLPQRETIALPAPGLRPQGLPALGMEISGINDWTTQHPFIDVMKTSRPWIGHLPGRWGGFGNEALRAAGHVGPDGWPLSIPDGVERVEALILTDQPEEATHLRGDYVLFYDGEADIELTGGARRVRPAPGRITFGYSPGGPVGISLQSIDPDNPIRNIRVVREEHLALHEAGVLFNPLWIEKIEDLRLIRFMSWMDTNGSDISRWADRPLPGDASYAPWGAPVEIMVALANQIGADPWFTLPHLADDDYVRNFAQLVKERLDPRLKAHVEFSNEVWNRIFPQAVWAAAQADARWGPTDTGWAQYYGLRAAQVMDIWTQVFGAEAEDRLVRVVSTHTGWPGMESEILEAPLAWLDLGRMPRDSFDAYAVTGYFGYEMGGEEMAARLNGWIEASERQATRAGEAQGLRRVALREFVDLRRYDAAFAPLAEALRDGSLRQLVEDVFPYHAEVAEAAGLQMIMYEGGPHLVGQGVRVDDERLTGLFNAFSYSPEMASLYETLLDGWVKAGGTLFNAFVDVTSASKWGSWGALRHLQDQNPRWDVLMAYNATGPNNWETRDPTAFANGITRIAGGGNQRLQGTAKADILLAGSGNDTLVSGGGQDHLHGGPGSDVAVLPGSRTVYRFERSGPRLVAIGPLGRITLTSIESLSFEATPGQVVSAAAL